MPDSTKPTIFVSYRRSDSPDSVKMVYERLKKMLPRWEVFYDHRSIPLGEPFPEMLRQQVTTAKVVLVIIGPQWLDVLRQRKDGTAVDHVREEVRLALESGNTVIPVPVGGAKMPSTTDVALFPDLQPLAGRNARPIRPEPDFDRDMETLVTWFETIGPEEGIGTVLGGKYKLVRELGVGGMGVVYAAEQERPRRTVAIKLVKPGMDSREVLARFDAERQALAVMEHPNISRVIDGGTTASGRPWFAMELVKGIPITEYCDDQKLPPNDRLQLFMQVCSAVQHAHQKGIIHRDIKPSNVLVEVVQGKPVPKVIDFGLAKALGYKLTDMSLYSNPGTRVGTLEYSSPEQAAGNELKVDTRTDVYALGTLLYELLAGTPPFTREELLKAGDEEMRRVLREQDPLRPSVKLSSSNSLPAIAANRRLEPGKLTSILRGDLDWIVMKALEREPNRRYESASSFSNDIGHYLLHEPVNARPPSFRYRFKKFVLRHRIPVVAGGAISILLVAGLIGTGLMWTRAIVEGERADQNAVTAREQSRLALESLEFVILDIQRDLQNVPGAGPIRRKLLQSSIERLDDVSVQFAPKNSIDRNTLVALIDLGDVFLRVGLEETDSVERLGPLSSAKRVFDQAFGMAQKLFELSPNDIQAKRDLSVTYIKLGDVLRLSGKNTEALEKYEKRLKISQELAEADPNANQSQRDLFISYMKVGDVFFESRQFLEALNRHQTALEISQDLAETDPNDTGAQRDLSTAIERVAMILDETGKTSEARKQYEKMFTIKKRLAELDPDDVLAQRELRVAHHHLGDTLFQSGNYRNALKHHQWALNISQKLNESNPSDYQTQFDLKESYTKIAEVKWEQEEYEQAIDYFDQGLKILRSLKEQNRLRPTDEKWIGTLEQWIRECRLEADARGIWTLIQGQSTQNSPELLVLRSMESLNKGRHAEATREIDKLREMGTATADQLYDSACIYSLCASAIKSENENQPLTAAQSGTREKSVADALATLREAIAAGYNDFTHMQNDADLAILRELPEFKELVPATIK